MKLKVLFTNSSTSCPTIYLAEDGDLVVQGQRLDSSTESELATVLPGETAVKISPQLLLGAALRYNDEAR